MARPLTVVASKPKEAEQVLLDPKYPPTWPFRPRDLARYDESADTDFYAAPRFVTHIDDKAIGALTTWYSKNLPSGPDAAILDMCSSWISHIPAGYRAGRVSGLGMNDEELARNEALTDYVVHDLNKDPKLPYEDASFDAVVNTVSVDYLTKPKEVFAETARVLKPGGLAAFSFSNRCFPTKAIAIWTATGDLDHVWIVGAYFHFTEGQFTDPQCEDISPAGGLWGKSDPMYVVFARKKGGKEDAATEA